MAALTQPAGAPPPSAHPAVPSDAAQPPAPATSVSWLVDFGWRLALAASLVAVATASPAVVVALLVGGRHAGLAAALGAAVTLVFFSLGQTAQVLIARWNPFLVLGASLVTYGLQVGLATVLIGGLVRIVDARWLFVGLAAAVLGWVVGLIQAFRRARRPIFDPPLETLDKMV